MPNGNLERTNNEKNSGTILEDEDLNESNIDDDVWDGDISDDVPRIKLCPCELCGLVLKHGMISFDTCHNLTCFEFYFVSVILPCVAGNASNLALLRDLTAIFEQAAQPRQVSTLPLKPIPDGVKKVCLGNRIGLGCWLKLVLIVIHFIAG